MTDYAPYKTGTIAVENGSPDVVGTGTLFGNPPAPGGVQDGDQLTVLGAGTDKLPYSITINNDTSITLDRNYEGLTGSGLSYVIFRTSGGRNSPRGSAAQLSAFLDSLNSLQAVDTDGTMAANSDAVVPSQRAVRTYLSNYIAANDVERFIGFVDCSTNPNYPAADAGHIYRVSVAGKIGGASGVNVEVNDRLECFVDSTASGNQATVGASWMIGQANLDGAIVSSIVTTRGDLIRRGASAPQRMPVGASGTVVSFDGTDTGFRTLTAILDGVVGSTRGQILRRSASAWEALNLGTNGYVLTSDGADVNWAASAGGGRPLLVGNRTYYVRTDGNDANNGLANTSGGAFLTIQKAIDTLLTLDGGGFTATIQVGAGTYAGAVRVASPFVGFLSVSLVGDTTTPTNVVINATSPSSNSSIYVSNGAVLNLRGFQPRATASGGCINADLGGVININGNMDYGAPASGYWQIYATKRGYIFITSSYTISGGAGYHWIAEEAGGIRAAGLTVTLSSTPAFSGQFAAANRNSVVSVESNTFSGSATGTKYLASSNATIFTNGGGASYLPGGTAGSTASGGEYA